MAQRIALLLIATLFVAMPISPAVARWQVDRAQAIAAKTWDHPCDDRVTVLTATPPEPTWRAWTYPRLCTIELSDTGPWHWEEPCPVMVDRIPRLRAAWRRTDRHRRRAVGGRHRSVHRQNGVRSSPLACSGPVPPPTAPGRTGDAAGPRHRVRSQRRRAPRRRPS
jgi:hypothetical protein